MVGRTWRGVLTPVYFEPCNFPSIITPKVLCSGIEWHILAIGASQVALVVKNPPANAGDKRDASSNPGSGRSPGEGTGYPLQYSCLENSMDRGAWKLQSMGSQRIRSHIHTHTHLYTVECNNIPSSSYDNKYLQIWTNIPRWISSWHPSLRARPWSN